MLLLQPTNHNNPDNPINPLDPHGKPTPMDRILIRRGPATRTLQGKLPHKRPLHLGRTTLSQHLTPHQPTTYPPPQHGIALPARPDLIIRDSPGLRCALKHDMWLRLAVEGRGGGEGDADQGGLALVGGEGEDAGAQGESERPGD